MAATLQAAGSRDRTRDDVGNKQIRHTHSSSHFEISSSAESDLNEDASQRKKNRKGYKSNTLRSFPRGRVCGTELFRTKRKRQLLSVNPIFSWKLRSLSFSGSRCDPRDFKCPPLDGILLLKPKRFSPLPRRQHKHKELVWPLLDGPTSRPDTFDNG